MKINPQALKLHNLSSIPLEDKEILPKVAGIYFAIDCQEVVQYIGRSININRRWLQHHRQSDLEECDRIKIAWLEISEPSLLDEVEQALIDYFQPNLNRIYFRPSPKNQSFTNFGVTKNKIKLLLDAKNKTRYQFWKDTGLAQNTAYRLYGDQNYIPGGSVMDKIFDAYGWQPGDYLYCNNNE